MREVTPGEDILPHLTAQWYNKTVRPPERRTGVGDVKPEIINPNHIYAQWAGIGDPAGYLDPVYVDALTPEKWIQNTNQLSIKVLDPSLEGWSIEWQWGIAHCNFNKVKQGPVAIWGITLANVNIVSLNHQYVNYIDGELRSHPYGKATILVPNENGPSLISIGNRTPASGIAFTEDPIPGRVSDEPGVGTGLYVDVEINHPNFTITTIELSLLNSQTEETTPGYVQWKESNGSYFVDVSPCYEE